MRSQQSTWLPSRASQTDRFKANDGHKSDEPILRWIKFPTRGKTILDMQPFGCLLSNMDEVFRALADPSRRSLLDRLHERNGQTLNELCDGLAMTRQAVTKHLVILEAANLVSTLRHGREKLHYLNPVPIHQIGNAGSGSSSAQNLSRSAS